MHISGAFIKKDSDPIKENNDPINMNDLSDRERKKIFYNDFIMR